jgi:hypothetical protein
MTSSRQKGENVNGIIFQQTICRSQDRQGGGLIKNRKGSDEVRYKHTINGFPVDVRNNVQ